jgi:putative hydrolase of the HAD superfamily
METLGITDPTLAAGIGDEYSDQRDLGMKPLPAAIDTVRWLRASSRRLALLTNGAGAAQRQKIERFGLTDLFDAILVEGEVGVGKPEELIYRQALSELGVRSSDAWMVGDNLEWDVAAPQKLGIAGVWIDLHGHGVPETSSVKPDYIVRALSDLRALPPLR